MEKQNKIKSKSQKRAKKSDKTKNVKNLFSARKGSWKFSTIYLGNKHVPFI